MTYHLTARDAARAALKAHAEGRLGYQRGHTACLYRYPDGAVCAIGAALPDYVVEGRGGYPVESLCGAGAHQRGYGRHARVDEDSERARSTLRLGARQ